MVLAGPRWEGLLIPKARITVSNSKKTMKTSAITATIVRVTPQPATMPLLDDWIWSPPRSSRWSTRIVHESSHET